MAAIVLLTLALGTLLVMMTVMAAGAVLNGYVLSILWGWFMVPVFSLPQLSIAPAIGLALVVGYLTKSPDYRKKTEKEGEKISNEQVVNSLLEVLLKPVFALLIGWVVHLFM